MAKKMLIDATHPEETRVVVVDGKRVEEFDFESESRKQLRGNIYLAKVTRVEPSLQAAFVEYGGNRHGFLAFSEIHPDYYQIPHADREAILKAQAERQKARQAQEDASDDEAADDDDIGDEDVADETDLLEADAEDNDAEDTDDDASEDDDTTDVDDAEDKADTAGEVSASADEEDDAASGNEDDEDDRSGGPALLAAKTESVSELPREEDGASDEEDAASDEKPEGEASAKTENGDTDGDADSDAESGTTEEASGEEASGETSGDAEETTQAKEGGSGRSRRRRSSSRRRRSDDDDGNGNGDEVESVGADDAYEEVEQSIHSDLHRRYKIQEVIKRRQILLVQVVKEERGNKGAALTTYLSLAGRYCVLMPNTARGGGISRKITNAADRKKLKEIAGSLEVPEGMGLIVRTAGAKRTKAEIKRDYEYLLRMWESVREMTLRSSAPALIYEEGNLVKRSIRDLYDKSIDTVLIEGDQGYKDAKTFMRMLMPSHAKNVQPYKDTQPLFQRFQVEDQLDSMFSPTVELKSGGYIVINPTEALVAIDVNSGRATRERNIEATALATNLEAAEEAARQMRLRDLAGLIVIDFIDMDENRNNRAVERKLKDCLKTDRARIQMGRISHFGLMELSRQRMRSGMLEGSTRPCPHCEGTGIIRSVESLSLHVLRCIEAEATKGRAGEFVVKVAPEVAFYILNQKRPNLLDIEARYGVTAFIEGSTDLEGESHSISASGEARAPEPRARPGTPISMQSAYDNESFDDSDEETEEPEPEVDASEDEDSDDEDTDGNRNRRRRRRRRGGRRDDQPEASESRSTDTDDDDGDANSNDRNRRRRRGRRGGRRNRQRGGSYAPGLNDIAASLDVPLMLGFGQNGPELLTISGIGQDARIHSLGAYDEVLPKPPRREPKQEEPEQKQASEPSYANDGASDESSAAAEDTTAEAVAAPASEAPAEAEAETVAALVADAAEASPEADGAAETANEEAVETASDEAPAAEAVAQTSDTEQAEAGEEAVTAEAPAPEPEPAPEPAPEGPKRRGWWSRRTG